MKKHSGKKLLAALGAAILLAGCGGPAVIPTSYSTYNAKNAAFKIDYPAEWTAEGGDKAGYAWAKFTSGSAEISVDANVSGSLVGDIAKSHIHLPGINVGQEEAAPVAAVHDSEKQEFDEEEGVEEEKPVPVKTGMNDARLSEFTGKKVFGGSIHGYRVTALSNDKRIRVVCECSERQWDALKPVFDKVIESLARGRPQY